MHAWTEVYIPGGGWRGYDPSRGIAVSTGHLAVAASVFPQFATPISGRYRGPGGANMEITVSLQVEEQ
jgi:transglutaminase-like putative cysteine protease